MLAPDARFDNPRAPQIRLTGFDLERLVEVGARVRDIYAEGASDSQRLRSTVDDRWQDTWALLPLFGDDGQKIFDHLLNEGFLDHDSGSAFIGPEAEKHFGRRHFMELLAVFTAAPEFIVFAGRQEVGSVEAGVLTDDIEGPRVLLLGGRSWKVTYIDWKRRRVFVEATDIQGRAKWKSLPDGASFEVTRGARDVLLGAQPPGVTLTRRAVATLEGLRDQRQPHVSDDALIITRSANGDWQWWTWAGAKANRTLAAWAPELVRPRQRIGAEFLRLDRELTVDDIRKALAALRQPGRDRPTPVVDYTALEGLKFSVALPESLARRTLAARTADAVTADRVIRQKVQIVSNAGPAA